MENQSTHSTGAAKFEAGDMEGYTESTHHNNSANLWTLQPAHYSYTASGNEQTEDLDKQLLQPVHSDSHWTLDDSDQNTEPNSAVSICNKSIKEVSNMVIYSPVTELTTTGHSDRQTCDSVVGLPHKKRLLNNDKNLNVANTLTDMKNMNNTINIADSQNIKECLQLGNEISSGDLVCKDVPHPIMDSDFTEVKLEIPAAIGECNKHDDIDLNPFLCGLCKSEFSDFTFFLAHLKEHKSVSHFLHSCNAFERNMESAILYTCLNCDTKFPTLCLLEEHILKAEHTNNFVINGKTRNAHLVSDSTLCNINELLKADIVDSSRYNIDLDTDIEDDHQGHTLKRSRTQNIKKRKRPSTNSVKRSSKGTCLKNDKLGNTRSRISEQKRWKTKRKHSKQKDNSSDILWNVNIKKEIRGKVAEPIASEGEDMKEGSIDVDDSVGNKSDTDTAHHDTGNNNQDMKPEIKEVKKRVRKKLDPLGKVSCSTCGEVHVRKEMNKHREKHTVMVKNMIVPCEMCGKNIKRGNMYLHIKTHFPPTLKCDVCGLGCRTKSSLSWHKSHVHAAVANYTCDKCGKAFKGPHYLKQHSLTHKETKDFQCPHCPDTFRVRQGLRAHLLTHTDDRPFTCDVCGKSFKSKGHLNDHKNLVHKPDTPYACSYCGKGFKTRYKCSKHERIHKPPEHFCPGCGRGFIMKDNMRTHVRSQHPNIDPATI